MEFVLVRKIKSIFSSVDICILRKGKFDECILFLFAEEDSDGWFLPFTPYMSVVVVHIHLHLAKILMSEFVNLEIYEDVALKKTVIEYKIHIEVFFVECESFLSGLKKESLSKFKEELLQFCLAHSIS